MLLGEPPERVDVGAHGIVAVHQDTPSRCATRRTRSRPLHLRSAARHGKAEFLDDVELSTRAGAGRGAAVRPDQMGDRTARALALDAVEGDRRPAERHAARGQLGADVRACELW